MGRRQTAPVPMESPDPETLRLHELGYAQELRRVVGRRAVFAISLSNVSVLAGAVSWLWFGMLVGGPRVIVLGWLVVGAFWMCIGASTSEIGSALPVSGGCYQWAGLLAGRNAPRWAWFTGWLSLVGHVGFAASVDFVLANFTLYSVRLFHSGFTFGRREVFGAFVVIVTLHGLLLTVDVGFLAKLGSLGLWWQVVGVAGIIGALLVFGERSRGIGELLEFRNSTGFGFAGSKIYVALLGLLMAQHALGGIGLAANLVEEVTDARVSVPRAVLGSIGVSALGALVLNLVMLATVPKGLTGGRTYYDTIASKSFLAGPSLFVGAFAGFAGKLLVVICTAGQFFCGLTAMAATGRLVFALGRDDALPGSGRWKRVNPRTRIPTGAVVLSVTLTVLAGTLTLLRGTTGTPIGFLALAGTGLVCSQISRGLAIGLRLASRDFVPGPWHLGRASRPVGRLAIACIAVGCVSAVLPTFSGWTTNSRDANLTGPIVLGLVFAVALGWRFWAKGRFHGPQGQGSQEVLAEIEGELSTFV